MEELKKLVTENYSISGIANILRISKTAVRCRLKKYGLKTNHKQYNQGAKKYPIVDGKRLCRVCGELKEVDDFYHHEHGNAICKICSNKNTTYRGIKSKIQAILYKGSICIDCGKKFPDEHYSIFDFHHLDPEQKDFDISDSYRGYISEIESELDKCILLCSDCHRKRHYKNEETDVIQKEIYEALIKGTEVKPVKNCPNCGGTIDKDAFLCLKCYAKKREKVERPPVEQLLTEVSELGYCAVGRKYGVSDNAIRKWLKKVPMV